MPDKKKFRAVLTTALLFTGTGASAAGDGILVQLKCGPNFDRPETFYPSTAARPHHSGVVLVEFSVNANGRAERLVVLQATAPKRFQSAALRVVKNFRCKPGKDWAETGGPEQRLRLNVVFKLQGEEAPKLIDEAAEVVTVTKIVARGVG